MMFSTKPPKPSQKHTPERLRWCSTHTPGSPMSSTMRPLSVSPTPHRSVPNTMRGILRQTTLLTAVSKLVNISGTTRGTSHTLFLNCLAPKWMSSWLKRADSAVRSITLVHRGELDGLMGSQVRSASHVRSSCKCAVSCRHPFASAFDGVLLAGQCPLHKQHVIRISYVYTKATTFLIPIFMAAIAVTAVTPSSSIIVVINSAIPIVFPTIVVLIKVLGTYDYTTRQAKTLP